MEDCPGITVQRGYKTGRRARVESINQVFRHGVERVPAPVQQWSSIGLTMRGESGRHVSAYHIDWGGSGQPPPGSDIRSCVLYLLSASHGSTFLQRTFVTCPDISPYELQRAQLPSQVTVWWEKSRFISISMLINYLLISFAYKSYYGIK